MKVKVSVKSVRLTVELTAQGIAEQAKVPLHRVQYVIRVRKITEDSRAGNIRLFGIAKTRQIIDALKE